MVDRFTERSSQGWLSRLGDSVMGVLVGVILVLVSFPALFLNEGRAVHTARSLSEGAGAVQEAPADRVDPSQEGHLVHVTGNTVQAAPVRDDAFGVYTPSLRLERHVEMFQWQEHVSSKTEKKLGGSKETVKTYEYKKGWHDGFVDSSSFKERSGHENPRPAYDRETFTATDVKLGVRALPDRLVGRVGKTVPLPPPAAPPTLSGRSSVQGNSLFLGADPGNPVVGDLRVSFKAVSAPVISVVSQQQGNTFTPFVAHAGDSVELIVEGNVPASEMFASAQSANSMLTWLLRVVGYLLMTLGFYLVMKPLAVVADVVPFVGSVIAAGAGLAGALVAAVFSSITVAVAWMFYRPWVTILMLVVGAAAFAVIAGMNHRRKVLEQVRGAPAGM